MSRRKQDARVLGPYEQHNGWRLVEIDHDGFRTSTIYPTEAEARRAKELLTGGSMTAGFVYFIQCNGPTGPVKIGRATHVERRFNAIQCDNPYPVELLAKMASDDMARDEALLHERFADSHIRGEWFEPHEDLLKLARQARNYVRDRAMAILEGRIEEDE